MSCVICCNEGNLPWPPRYNISACLSDWFVCVRWIGDNESKDMKRNVLLLSSLGALGGAGVVADLLSEANRHGDVTVVHGNHGHLFSRWSMRDAETADVWLKDIIK